MPREQRIYPEWWTNLKAPQRVRERLRATFTIGRDGYLIWYKGRTRVAAAKSVPPAGVEDEWQAKRKRIDADLANVPPPIDPATLSYRAALSEFLAVQEARVGAVRRPLAERTYHNYVTTLNDLGAFRFEGRAVADTPLAEVGPRHFSAYAKRFAHYQPSGFDSLVGLVSAFFRWAVEMEYIDRFRPGPEFIRPERREVRDRRIDLTKSFTPRQVAQLYVDANLTVQCWIALGVCAAFNNADVAHVTRTVMNLDTGVIDFRRRKTGKVRRIIPLPAHVHDLLLRYVRPEPADKAFADLFFLTEGGQPYTRNVNAAGAAMPSNAVSRLFGKLMDAAGIPRVKGRNFSGLRTTFYNLAPVGYEVERMVIMGRARGTVDLDHYFESPDMQRLRFVTDHVWSSVQTEIDKLSSERRGAARKESVHASDVAASRSRRRTREKPRQPRRTHSA